MRERKESLIFKLVPHLPKAEKVFLLGLAVGLILFFTSGDKIIVRISIGALAVIFFLSSFKPLDVPETGDKRFGFKELLTWIMIPKILWIGSAFSILGILVYTLQLGHDGHMRALMPGGSTIAIGLLVILYSWATGTKHLSVLLPTIIRVVPVMLIALYIVWTTIKSHG